MGAEGTHSPAESKIVNTSSFKEDKGPCWSDVSPFFHGTLAVLGLFLLVFTDNLSIVIWFGFVLVPIQDMVMAEDRKNVVPSQIKSFEKDWRFNIPLLLTFCLDIVAYAYFMIALGYGTIGKTFGDFITVSICASLIGASNTVIGHELYHRRNKTMKFLGLVSHLKFLSGHIPVFHNEIHHKHTGIVEKDLGFTPKGKSIYQVLDIMGISYNFQTMKYEDERLQKRGLLRLPQRILSNRIIRYRVFEILYLIGLYYFLGWKVLIFQLLYCQINTILLTTTNYVEHYGLQRKRLNTDKPNEKPVYEPQGRHHSWDSNAAHSNKIMYNVQRHSDHHMFVYKPYQILESVENTPTLPFGYSGGIMVALCPPVWKAVIDPMLDAFERGEKMTEEQLKNQKKIVNLFFGIAWTILTIIQIFVFGIRIPENIFNF